MNDQAAMMLMAATIGVVHLMIANLINAWNPLGQFAGDQLLSAGRWRWPAAGSWQSLGWTLHRWCRGWPPGSAARTAQTGAALWQIGTFALITGLLAVFAFSSDRPLFSRRRSDWLWRPVEGLLGLTNISKAFGDSLSYLRLFALGLASAQLAVTFNTLAAGAMEISGIGLLLGSVIFLIGHALNLLLGIVGGVVHGLRLNCIEFFSWSLTEEGYPFRAFCKKAGR
jgi:V/A-type H+/Na+-transporting ATPase subunit I